MTEIDSILVCRATALGKPEVQADGFWQEDAGERQLAAGILHICLSMPSHRLDFKLSVVAAQETSSGEERKRMAQDFNAERTPEALAGLETETKQMMQAACASALGQQSLFSATCAKLHTDTD